MSVMQPITRAWRSVELRIAFFKSSGKSTPTSPRLWAPKDATAALLDRPQDQEALLFLKSDDPTGDVEMCLRQSQIVAKRDTPRGWSAIAIEDDVVRISVGDVIYIVKADGSLTRHCDDDMTAIEADGSIVKSCDGVDILVSSDGEEMSRRSEYQFDVISPDGVMSRRR